MSDAVLNEFDESPEDQETLAAFVQELSDSILNLETGLIDLEKDVSNKDKINAVFRLFHNVKGASGMMSLTTLMEITHWSESLLDLARKDQMTLQSHHIDALLESLSAVREIAERLKATKKEGAQRYFHLLAKLSDLIDKAASEGVQAVEKSEQAAAEVADGPRHRDDDMIKVSRHLIDQMMLLVGEFMQVKNRFDWLSRRYEDDPELFDNCRELEAFSGKLQRTVLKLRLSPVNPLFQSMHRVVRATGQETGKRVQLEIIGGDTLLDRTILDVLSEPLMHILRNAIDHGIEGGEERAAANKPADGQVQLRAAYRSGEIHISITDDGKGLNAEKIGKKAIEKGFVTTEQVANMSPTEKVNLIFLPGFSSAEVITQVSGRGVGMDVVRSTIESVGGQVEIQTEVGVGSTFNLRLPLSLAIIDCLGFRVGEQAAAIPQINVEEVYSNVSQVVRQNLTRLKDNALVLVVRDTPIPVIDLRTVFGTTGPEPLAYIVTKHGKTRFALAVDQITGPISLVSHPIPSAYGKTPLSGITKQGDGSLLFLADVGKLSALIHHSPVDQGRKNSYMTTDGRTETAAMLTSSDIRRLQQKIITFQNIQNFCVPVQRAKRIVHVEAHEINEFGDRRQSYVTIDSQTIPLIWVEELLLNAPRIRRPSYSMVIFQISEQQYAIPLADFTGIKRMPENYDRTLADVGINGSTVIDEQTFLLLDLHGLVDKFRNKPIEKKAKSDRFHIVAAEDDMFFATEMLASLRGNSYEVTHFKDGLEAKNALEDEDFVKTVDLIITDIEMPNLNGLGLMRWIKSCAHTKHLACIVYTAISTTEMRMKSFQAGAAAMVSKMSMDHLLNEVKRVRESGADGGNLNASMAEPAIAKVNRIITLQIGEHWLGLPMDGIKEVSKRTASAPIPGASRWMPSVTFFRGHVIPVIDLGELLGVPSDGELRDQAVLEVNGVVFAVKFERVVEVLPLSSLTQGDGIPSIDEETTRYAGFTRTSYSYGEQVLALLDTSALAALARTGEIERRSTEGKAA